MYLHPQIFINILYTREFIEWSRVIPGVIWFTAGVSQWGCPTSWALLPPALGASWHIPTQILALTTPHPHLFHVIQAARGFHQPYNVWEWKAPSCMDEEPNMGAAHPHRLPLSQKTWISNGWTRHSQSLAGICCVPPRPACPQAFEEHHTIHLWFQEPLPAASSLLKGQGKPGRSRMYSCKSFPSLAVKEELKSWLEWSWLS